MAKDYKLCPKCNNALDNGVIQCPYCGENLWISFWTWTSNSWFGEDKLPSTEKKKSWCWCWCFVFIIFIFFIIWSIISSLLDELDEEELSELKEVVTQEFGNILGLEDSDVNYSSETIVQDNETVVQEENAQRVLNTNEKLAIDVFDEFFEAIEYLNYPKYQDEEWWDVELGTSTSEGVNGSKKNIVILKYRWLEFKRYFLQLDEDNLVFFFDDENNNIHRVTENEVLEDILPVFEECLTEAGR